MEPPRRVHLNRAAIPKTVLFTMKDICMIDGQWVLALIPARSGSKGLPGKNMLSIGGAPLVAWTIRSALNSQIVDQVVVSSDSQEVLDLAAHLGAMPLERPSDLATDSALASAVIRHGIEGREDCDVVVYLQPTSPLRTSTHIDEALRLLEAGTVEAVVSVCETRVSPELMYRTDASGHLEPIVAPREERRQNLPTTYVLNGAIYAAYASALARANYRFQLLKPAAYVMLEIESIDIDYPGDFEEARKIMEEYRFRFD